MRAGAGGLGAFAMRMGRMVIPIVREHILRVAEQVGKNLLETAIPEISQILAGRKKPSDRMLKHVAKTAAEESLRTSGTLLTAEWAATPGARGVRHGGSGRTAVDRYKSGANRFLQQHYHHPPHLCSPKTI